jgi:hypothetical protein
MKSRWADGLRPRHFVWVLAGSLALSERPGGHSRNHRPVRRQEEILWLKEQGFTRVVSLLPSPHNLHAYEAAELACTHLPLPSTADLAAVLPGQLAALEALVAAEERMLVHHETMGDAVMGVAAAYLVWVRRLSTPAQASTVLERLAGRRMGPDGRAVLLAGFEAAVGAGRSSG